jgi:hypothetical protein
MIATINFIIGLRASLNFRFCKSLLKNRAGYRLAGDYRARLWN